MEPGDVVRLEVPAAMVYRSAVLRVVGSVFKTALATRLHVDELADQVVSAVGEAFNNVVRHCYGSSSRGVVHLEVQVGNSAVRVVIEDYGQGFDPLEVATPNLDLLPESGLGIYIMRSFMDEVRYTAGSPNVLTLVKRIPDEGRCYRDSEEAERWSSSPIGRTE